MSAPGRHARWLVGAAVALASAVLALVAPTSAWGLTFIGGVVVMMLALRPVVPAAYRGSWTRSVLLVSVGAVLGGLCYAFAVAPWGPRPVVAWPLGIALLVLAFVPLADLVGIGTIRYLDRGQGRRMPPEWLPPQDRRHRRG